MILSASVKLTIERSKTSKRPDASNIDNSESQH